MSELSVGVPGSIPDDRVPEAGDSSPAPTRKANYSSVSAILVGLLAIASFVLSFEALEDLARRSGAIAPGRAWVFPLVVDGAIIVFSISALQASLQRKPTKWPVTLVIITTVLSVLLNLAHAPKGLMPSLVGCTPPLLLFLSFETLMRQLKDAIDPTDPGTHQPVTGRMKGSAPIRRIQFPVVKSQPLDGEKRREQARIMLDEGRSKASISKQLGMSLKTLRKIQQSAGIQQREVVNG